MFVKFVDDLCGVFLVIHKYKALILSFRTLELVVMGQAFVNPGITGLWAIYFLCK